MKKEIICILTYTQLDSLLKKICKKGAIQFAMKKTDKGNSFIMKEEKKNGDTKTKKG